MINIPIPWTNDVAAYGRQYTVNRKDQFQTRPDGAYASATAKGGQEISLLPVGGTVKLNVGEVPYKFIIVNQGNPGEIYDESCNGTWLLMEEAYEETIQWNSADNDYENSNMHSYLNGTFLGQFDESIQAVIKQVKIPYHKGTGSSGTIQSGANGLSAKVFLLSGYEMGWTTSNSPYFPIDGVKLSYFESGTATSANAKRRCYQGGTATGWWLRSASNDDTVKVFYVTANGAYAVYDRTGGDAYRTRPAFVLPSDFLVSLEPDADGCYTLIGGVS